MQKWLLLSVSVALLSSACAYPVSSASYGGRPPAQTIELYDASRRHIGYGKVQGGTLELYKPDGSRAGYGTLKR